VIRSQFKNLYFIRDGWLEEVRMRSCHRSSRKGCWCRIKADAREEIARSLEAIMVVVREMLGLEWLDPLLTMATVQIRDDLLPNAQDLD
jgi:hypothetical protein